MKVLIVGAGGREHALAWKVAQSTQVSEVHVAPGNAGTADEPSILNVGIDSNEIDSLVRHAKDNAIELTIVGPETPLTLGIVDEFENHGLRCFGPKREAARIEGSKDFAKSFMIRHGIPTAKYQTFDNVEAACKYIDKQEAPIVIKADGLAAGKGVLVADSADHAKFAVADMMTNKRFGEAGERLIIEQCLTGEEVSYICIVDGENILPMAASQDHKSALDEGKGPNTGGMGAYSPPPIVDSKLEDRIMNEIIHPVARGMLEDGIRYTGFLYAGLMIDGDGNPNVLEFNCRLGDPETQPIMMRLQSDLIDLIMAALDGCLANTSASWDSRASLGVVIAADGYPGDYAKGTEITGLEDIDDDSVKVFHAGTAKSPDGKLIVNGGRVLCVTSLDQDIAQAQSRAYKSISHVTQNNLYYRKDIGHKALSTTSNSTG